MVPHRESRVRSRVAEIYVEADIGGGRCGRVASGYAIGDDLVLTAGHVLDTADETTRVVQVRPLGRAQWISGGVTVAWCRSDGQADAALLRVAGAPWRDLADSGSVRWGVITPDEAVRVTAVGFPASQKRPEGIRDTEETSGRISPNTRAKSGRLVVDIASPPPRANGWYGMSGAALLSAGRHLLGVIAADVSGFGHRRLEATGAGALLADPDFAAVTGHPEAEPVGAAGRWRPASGTLLEPYVPLPARYAEAQLLVPRHGLVPFLGRAAELAGLEAWCASAEPLSIAVVSGAAGAGKTRLAAELCARMRDSRRWDAFFAGLDPAEGPGGWADADPDWPLLLVFDYPEQAVPALVALIRRLAGRVSGPRVRLLLASREAGRWWDDVNVDTSGILAEATDVRIRLGGDEFGAADRAEHAAAAMAAFADHLGLPRRDPPDVNGGEYASPLLVHAAALAAVHGEKVDHAAPGSLRDKLLDSLLDRERRRWRRGQQATGMTAGLALGTGPAHQSVALATLTMPERAECRELLQAIPDLADATAERRGQIADWLTWLYPTGEHGEAVAPLQPDLVAERLLATTPELGRLLMAIAGQSACTAEHLLAMLQALRLAADHNAIVRDALHALLAARLQTLLGAATSAYASGLARVLDECLLLFGTEDARLAASADADGSLRYPSLPSRIAVTIAEFRVTHQRALAERADTGERRYELAGALYDLAAALGEIGRNDDAVPHAEEAIAVMRRIAADEPDRYRLDLARTLHNLALALSNVKRPTDALAASRESAGIFADLHRENPVTYAPFLARGLSSLAIDLTDSGQHDEAVTVAEQAVNRYRELAAADFGEYGPGLSQSLTTLATALARAGRPGEAVTASEEAVSQQREYVAGPGRYQPVPLHHLAMALNNLAADLKDAGRPGDAVTARREMVWIYQQLAAFDPDRYERFLLTALRHLRDLLEATGQRADAREALYVTEYLSQLSRETSTLQPDDSDRQRRHAEDLHHLAYRRAGSGDLRGAVTAEEEAAARFRELTAEDPARYRPLLALALHHLCGWRLAERDAARAVAGGDDAARAVADGDDAVRIRRDLCSTDPGQANKADLASSLSSLGVAYSELGDKRSADECCGEAVSILRELCANGTEEYRPQLASALMNHGRVLARSGKPADALAWFLDAVQLHRQLAAASPGHHQAQLADSLHNLGSLLVHDGMASQALPLFEEAVTLFLARAEAGDLSVLDHLRNTQAIYGRLLIQTGRVTDAQELARRVSGGIRSVES